MDFEGYCWDIHNQITMSKRPLTYCLKKADTIFFLHIPKSAGTTFYSILAKHFPPDKIWPIDDEGLISHIIEKGPESVRPYRLLRAHYDYSIYEYLSRKPVYVTMLRDPVERVISYYYHVKRVPTHKLHKKIVENHVSLREFLDPPMAPSETKNYQVRALAGVVRGSARSLSDRGLLEIARVRLNEFAYFGLVEFFDESKRANSVMVIDCRRMIPPDSIRLLINVLYFVWVFVSKFLKCEYPRIMIITPENFNSVITDIRAFHRMNILRNGMVI